MSEQQTRSGGDGAATVLANVPDPAVVVDGEGCLSWWNDRVPSLTGEPEAALAGREAATLVATDDRERFTEALLAVLTEGDERTVTAAIRTPDGPRPHEFSISPVSNPNPNPNTDTDTDTDPLRGSTHPAAVAVGRDVTDRERSDGDLERYERLVEAAADGVYALDAEGHYTAVNESLAEILGYDREELLGVHAGSLLDEDDHEKAVAAVGALVEGESSVETLELELEDADGETVHVEDHLSRLSDEQGEFVGTMGVFRDVSERARQERELRRQRDELETLTRVGETVTGVVRELVDAGSREEIERTVCERLTASDLYDMASVSRFDTATGTVTPAYHVGFDGQFEAVWSAMLDLDWEPLSLAAARTGEIQVLGEEGYTRSEAEPTLPDDEATVERIRELADRLGLEVRIAVPIVHRDRTYGSFFVNAPRPEAFSERELAAFRRLGRVVGFAINAIETRNLLHADTVTELELAVPSDEEFFTRLTGRFDCETRLEWTTDRDDSHVQYVSVSDDVGAVVAAAADEPTVTDCEVVAEVDGEALLAVTRRGDFYDRLSDVGATLVAATARDGVSELTVRTSPRTDVRSVTEMLGDFFPEAELTAKRTVDRPLRTEAEFRESLADRLTQRQRTVVRTAFFAGYYDWPRETTAEGLADRMDVTSATLHYHLRHAERELIAAFVGQ